MGQVQAFRSVPAVEFVQRRLDHLKESSSLAYEFTERSSPCFHRPARIDNRTKREHCYLVITGISPMADIAYYVALPFSADDEGSIVAGTAEEFQSASTAIRRAETLSRIEGVIGALAFTRSGGPDDGRFQGCNAAEGLRQRSCGPRHALTFLRGRAMVRARPSPGVRIGGLPVPSVRPR